MQRDHPRLKVPQTARVIDDGKRADVVEEGVHGEVAPERVLLRCAERIVAVKHTIVAASGRHGLRDVVARRPAGEGRQLFGRELPPERRDFERF